MSVTVIKLNREFFSRNNTIIIPEFVTHLEFSNLGLHEVEESCLSRGFKRIPEQVKTVDLTGNCTRNRATERLTHTESYSEMGYGYNGFRYGSEVSVYRSRQVYGGFRDNNTRFISALEHLPKSIQAIRIDIDISVYSNGAYHDFDALMNKIQSNTCGMKLNLVLKGVREFTNLKELTEYSHLLRGVTLDISGMEGDFTLQLLENFVHNIPNEWDGNCNVKGALIVKPGTLAVGIDIENLASRIAHKNIEIIDAQNPVLTQSLNTRMSIIRARTLLRAQDSPVSQSLLAQLNRVGLTKQVKIAQAIEVLAKNAGAMDLSSKIKLSIHDMNSPLYGALNHKRYGFMTIGGSLSFFSFKARSLQNVLVAEQKMPQPMK